MQSDDFEDGWFDALTVYTPSAREQLSRHGLVQGGPRQPCCASNSDLGFADCFKLVAVAGENSASQTCRSPATPAAAATQKALPKAKHRLNLVSAAARVNERQGNTWAFLLEEKARDIVCRALGEADAALATCLMDAMRLLPTPPPADQPRTAALIFTALLLTASTAGRGAAGFLMELLVHAKKSARLLGAAGPPSHAAAAAAAAAGGGGGGGGQAAAGGGAGGGGDPEGGGGGAAAAAGGGGSPPAGGTAGCPGGPLASWRDVLKEAAVLLRHAECGEEVQPVLEAVEQALMLEERDRLRQQQEAVWGPGGLLLTQEQIDAARLSFRDLVTGEPITNMLQAWAGSAKTTQLRILVQMHRRTYFYVLSFNKDIRDSNAVSMDADLLADYNAGKCPRVKNYKVSTTHGFAREIQALEDKPRALTTAHMRGFLAARWGAERDKVISAGAARAVRDTLDCFMASADPQLDARHLPQDPRRLQQMDEQVSVVMWRLDRVPERQIAHLARIGPHPDYSRRKVVEAAQALWQEVASRRTASGAATRLPLPFNCYIKRCALQGLRLKLPPPPPWGIWTDVVLLVDEAQDLNAATMQMVYNQGTPVVLAGDRFQQLYAFNHACGAMTERVSIPQRVVQWSLSQTFRFGPEIAFLVNSLVKTAFGALDYLIGRPAGPTGFHPGVVYVTVPDGRDLDSVLPGELERPSRPRQTGGGRGGDGGAAGGTQGGTQQLQAPWQRGTQHGSTPQLGSTQAGGTQQLQAQLQHALQQQRPYSGMRLLQCPLRGRQPDAAFPAEWRVTPICGVAVLPPPTAAASLPAVLTAGGAKRLQLCYIARYNHTLVRAALELVAAGRTVHGSFKSKLEALVGRVQDVAAFLSGRRDFGTEHELHGLADEAQLQQLLEVPGAEVELITAYELARTNRVEEIRNLESKLVDEEAAEYVLTTVHKMKGREAQVVQLADDYSAQLATGTEDGRRRLLWQRSSGSQSDELNAVYVAATRPHTVLLLSRDLSRLALGLHRRHVQLVLPAAPPQPPAAGPASAAATATAASPQLAAAGASHMQQPPNSPQGLPLLRTQQQPDPSSNSVVTPRASTGPSSFARMIAAAGQGAGGTTLMPTARIDAGSTSGAMGPPGRPGGNGMCDAAMGKRGGGPSQQGDSHQQQDQQPAHGKRPRHGGMEVGMDVGTPSSQQPTATPRQPMCAAGASPGPSQSQPQPQSQSQATPSSGAALQSQCLGSRAEQQGSCALCACTLLSRDLASHLPRVTWRGRPVCRTCGRERTLFGQLLELAEEAEDAQKAAARRR
ncbi:hypothetical protein CHLRE_01g047400v5 [Chlamydomonas reinhardtii]|uniref:Uncharacterized protein n=1 Tax=Chlamydomonas reinhardtii TaxID=3055 RepID=A0A2K3E7T4_CHLRE|nr:uncharacterized protein CHLRE_01g047400v5 [Chlamydomonas reinhardtii]PNW88848.1 hypothetical protein CHLRE_01g047400v5 [Chlamydomonas reinhardtii]